MLRRLVLLLVAVVWVGSVWSLSEVQSRIDYSVQLDQSLANEKAVRSQDWQSYRNRDIRPFDDWDALYYSIDIDIDIPNEFITGHSVIRALTLADNIPTIIFDFADNMVVDTITLNNQPLSYTRADDQVVVQLNANYPSGTTLDLIVDYHGNPNASGFTSGGLFFTLHGPDNVPQVYSMVEPFFAREWWPCKDHPSDKANSIDIRVTCPVQYIVAANGLLQSDTLNPDNTKTWHWHSDYPISTYLVSIALTNYQVFTQTFTHNGQEMPVQHYIFPEIYDVGVETFQQTPGMIAFLSEVYGTYPFMNEKYGHAVAAGMGGAMEHQTCTTFGEAITNPNSYSTVLHELAHQWVGDYVTCADWAHIWLNEGFATYSEALYTEEIYGHNWYLYHMTQYDSGVNINDKLERDPIEQGGYVLDWVVYAKGAWVLHMLRGMMGDETFFDFLHTYMETPGIQYGIANTDLLCNVAEQVSGMELSWYFDQWFHNVGRPVYQYCTYTSDQADGFKLALRSSGSNNQPFAAQVPYRNQEINDSFFAPDGFSYQSFEGLADSLLLDPKNWLLDGGFTEWTPTLVEPLMDRNFMTTLLLPPKWDPQSPGYLVYRRITGNTFTCMTPEPVTDIWIDGDVVPGCDHYYKIAAVSGTDPVYHSKFSNVVTLQPIDFTFDMGVLIVDGTINGTPTSQMPTDEEMDNYYESILSGYDTTNWDFIQQGFPPLAQLARYEAVVFHFDDFNTIPFLNDSATLRSYLEAGGKIIVSSWKFIAMVPTDIAGRYFGFDSSEIQNVADFIGASSGTGWPRVDVDPEKVPAAIWNGRLPYIQILHPTDGTEVLYGFDSATDSAPFENGVCGIRFGGNVTLFSFPLYYLMEDQARSLVRQALTDYGVICASHDETVPESHCDLSVRPNPFNPSTTVSFDLPQDSHVSLDVFNVRGQKVAGLIDQPLRAGRHEVVWNGTDDARRQLSSGVYFFKLYAGGRGYFHKVLLVK